MKSLKDDERNLLNYVLQRKKVISTDPKTAALARDPKKSFIALEKKLLVHSTEEHTASGKHIKVYTSWAKSKIALPKPKDYLAARAAIEGVVKNLSHLSGARVKLPW